MTELEWHNEQKRPSNAMRRSVRVFEQDRTKRCKKCLFGLRCIVSIFMLNSMACHIYVWQQSTSAWHITHSPPTFAILLKYKMVFMKSAYRIFGSRSLLCLLTWKFKYGIIHEHFTVKWWWAYLCARNFHSKAHSNNQVFVTTRHS